MKTKLLKSAIKAAGITMVLMAGTFATAAEAAQKIAVVFPAEVFQQLPQRDQIIKTLKKEFQPRVNELQKLEKKIKGIQEKQQRDAALLSGKEKTKMARDIESFMSDYQLKRKAFEEDNRRRQGEEQNKLRTKVMKAIDAVAKKEGYDLVVNGEGVLFAKPDVDISSKVVDQVSKSN